MDLTTLIITVFCLIETGSPANPSPAPARPQPTLADSEVLTIECVGEFLGIDTDVGLYQYFCRHWTTDFRPLDRVTCCEGSWWLRFVCGDRPRLVDDGLPAK